MPGKIKVKVHQTPGDEWGCSFSPRGSEMKCPEAVDVDGPVKAGLEALGEEVGCPGFETCICWSLGSGRAN